MSKPFLENMNKEERQAFSYLENLIIKSKMECLAVIPKTQVYDDIEIKNNIEKLASKMDKIEKLYNCINNSWDTLNKIQNIMKEKEDFLFLSLEQIHNFEGLAVAYFNQLLIAEYINDDKNIKDLKILYNKNETTLEKINNNMDKHRIKLGLKGVNEEFIEG